MHRIGTTTGVLEIFPMLNYIYLCAYAAKMIPLFMMFAGGPLGSGKQW